jgi:RNA polymerase sigma-70 factor (ECF subfamily)
VSTTVALLDTPLDALVVDAAPTHAVALGTRAEFEDAVRPLLPRLHRYALVLTRDRQRADDLVQDALVKAFLRRDGFAARGSFVGWLLGILRHEHLEAARTAARRRSLFRAAIDRFVGALDDTFAATPAPTPEEGASTREASNEALRCLAEVPEPYRTALVLCDLEDLGYDEVAETLGVPVGTVKSRHARARRRLREIHERREVR